MLWEIYERKTLFSVKIALIGLIPMLYCVNQDGVYYVFIHSQFVFAIRSCLPYILSSYVLCIMSD